MLLFFAVMDKQCEIIAQAGQGQSQGYIVNTMTSATGCGSDAIPWVVRALPGQRINVTLFDFAAIPPPPASSLAAAAASSHLLLGQGHQPSAAETVACNQQYAEIREHPISSSSRLQRVCGGGSKRQQIVYTSTSHVLDIMIGGRQATPPGISESSSGGDTAVHFLLMFEGTVRAV